ncbi:hypothetical protein ABW19_dt0202597 [Dactylella cylindrospora]|nr:hypothetical protein ABW19_dt0202597 [Dactylella cylindrospora]
MRNGNLYNEAGFPLEISFSIIISIGSGFDRNILPLKERIERSLTASVFTCRQSNTTSPAPLTHTLPPLLQFLLYSFSLLHTEIFAMAGGAPIQTRVVANDRELTGAAALTLRQSLLPCAMVTTLFFLWGFAYGLLDVLNAHFQSALNITRSQSSGLQGAYFGAYFLFPLIFGGPILRRFGYKITFMTGLVVFGVGCFGFWPSGIYSSFGGFCGSMAIVGAGLSTLEVSANPFLATCGPPKYSEIRLTTAQSVQAVGTVVAPVLASYVFFKDANDLNSLKNVQWVYLGVGVFVFCLAGAFWFAPIPEITDADMEYQVTSDETTEVGPLRKQITLFWGVGAQWCYVGAQVAVAGFFINYSLETGRDHATSSNLLAVAQGLFAIGRFAASAMMKWVRPRYVLTIFLFGCMVFSILAMNLGGTTGLVMLNLVLFFESCCFPIIFTLAIKKLGRHTKIGSSFLVSSICGGAIWPQFLAQVADHRDSTHFAMIIPFIGFTLAFSFPIYVNLFQRERMDIAPEVITPPPDDEESINEKAGVVTKERL